jgi:hypothetical protein
MIDSAARVEFHFCSNTWYEDRRIIVKAAISTVPDLLVMIDSAGRVSFPQ